MKVFTEVESNILQRLAHYKYLTLSQMVKVNVGGKSYTCTRLKQLREAGYVGVSQYGGVYKSGGGGRAENINYLTPKGAKLLASMGTEWELENIRYPKNIDGIFRNDYFHRISTVNVQIAFELWCKWLAYEIVFFDAYFYTLGSAKKSKENDPLRGQTTISVPHGKPVAPDGIFAVDTGKKKLFFCLEVHNGADVTRLVEQAKALSRAVAKGYITNHYKTKYDIQNSPRVLFTVETENMLRLVKKRLVADTFFSPAWMKEVFLFNVAEQVWNDFESGWQNMEGNIYKLSML